MSKSSGVIAPRSTMFVPMHTKWSMTRLSSDRITRTASARGGAGGRIRCTGVGPGGRGAA